METPSDNDEIGVRMGMLERVLDTGNPRGSTILPVGAARIRQAGYVRVDFTGRKRGGDHFPALDNLILESNTPGLRADYVSSNDGDMFYWGRRGPSVHLHYTMPENKSITHAYSEITVPEGMDPVGSYFMANGFAEGYFGIQVNGPSERRVLFSVWSPFQTDNPHEIPEEERIVNVAKSDDTLVRDFGGEGSGGQSFLRYPWKAGVTYRFLTEVQPDGNGNTGYFAWVGEASTGEWKLVAGFRRPKTDTYLRGFHSFLENFHPSYGHLRRKGVHSNPWVKDTDGVWHAITRATFTGDGTAAGGHRLDHAGGVENGEFFLRNGGFFDDNVPLGTRFHREAGSGAPPAIDLKKLPR